MKIEPGAFAAAWIDGWNRRDLETVLGFYAPNVQFTSPLAQKLTGHATVVGRDALRAYWTEGLKRRPALRFELIEVFEGAGGVAIHFQDENGRRTVETLHFASDGKVERSMAFYRG